MVPIVTVMIVSISHEEQRHTKASLHELVIRIFNRIGFIIWLPPSPFPAVFEVVLDVSACAPARHLLMQGWMSERGNVSAPWWRVTGKRKLATENGCLRPMAAPF